MERVIRVIKIMQKKIFIKKIHRLKALRWPVFTIKNKFFCPPDHGVRVSASRKINNIIPPSVLPANNQEIYCRYPEKGDKLCGIIFDKNFHIAHGCFNFRSSYFCVFMAEKPYFRYNFRD